MDDTDGAALKPEIISGEAEASLASSTETRPFFERADWQSFWLTAPIIFAVFLFTLCPSIELEYSGTFATGAMYAGVPDTPGFPLWTIYAYCFTLLPVSNIAWRISLGSAVATAIACGLIALIVSRGGALLLENLRGFDRPAPKSERWIRIIGGYVAGMAFGLAGSVWSHSVIVDWWPLTFAMFAAVICFMMRWNYTPEKPRYLYAAFVLYGLALTNSQSLIVVLPGMDFFILVARPALGRDVFAWSSLALIHIVFAVRDSVVLNLWYVYVALAGLTFLVAFVAAIKTRHIFTEWKTVLICFCLIVLGLALYFYCAIASMTNPPLNWNYPRTVEGFFHLVKREQYERTWPVDEWPLYWQQIQLYWGIVGSDYGWLYLLPAATPFLWLHRMRPTERRWLYGLLVIFLCESFFLIALLNPNNDRVSREIYRIYFGPSLLVLAITTGCGLVMLGARLTRSKPAT